MKTSNKKRLGISEEAEREPKPQYEENPSVLRSLGKLQETIARSIKKQMVDETLKEFSSQIFSGNSKDEEVKMELNQVIDLKDKNQEKRSRIQIQNIENIRAAEIRKENQDQASLEQTVQQILLEIKRLTKSSKELEAAFKEANKQEMPVKAGRYHLNFLEWLLATVSSSRKRIEESINWTNMFASRKKQKQYWNMQKKHGTTFSLSQERTTATQTG